MPKSYNDHISKTLSPIELKFEAQQTEQRTTKCFQKDKIGQKWAWPWSRDPLFKFWDPPPNISQSGSH